MNGYSSMEANPFLYNLATYPKGFLFLFLFIFIYFILMKEKRGWKFWEGFLGKNERERERERERENSILENFCRKFCVM